MEEPRITQGPDGEPHQERLDDRRQRDYARMARYRQLANNLRDVANDLEGNRGVVVLQDAIDVLAHECANIARKYQQ